MRLGCCYDAPDVELVKQAGFDFIDLNGSWLAEQPMEAVERLAKRMHRLSLPCVGLHATFPPEVAIAGPGFDPERVQAYWLSLLPKAQRLGLHFIGIGSPASRRLPEGYGRDLALGQLRQVLALGMAIAPEPVFLMEALYPGETNAINTQEDALAVLESLPENRTGLVLDIYHFLRAGETEAALSAALLSRVRYLHIADPVGRRYPSVGTEAEVYTLLCRLLERTQAAGVAIEALTDNFAQDAPQAVALMRGLEP